MPIIIRIFLFKRHLATYVIGDIRDSIPHNNDNESKTGD